MESLASLSIAVAFWIAIGLVAYPYVVYPTVIWILARTLGWRAAPSDRDTQELPRVSALVVAHNEESIIAERIDNLLSLDYPSGKLEIVIATDGCSDGTAAVVRRYADKGVRLIELPVNGGKAAALNAAWLLLTGEIVVLSDANTMMARDAARKLVRWFVKPSIGIVSGKLVLRDPATGLNVDGMYWRYETFLKKCEGRLGALLGANGGIYAIRRGLFPELQSDTIVDDFFVPLAARLRTGCEIVFDPQAIAVEDSAPSLRSEFGRRTRIGAGGFQALARLWRLLHPRQGWIAFSFGSHKVLRWLCPFFLILAFILNLVLLESKGVYALSLAAQITFYLLAAFGLVVSGSSTPARVVRLTTMFAGMNLALLVGFYKWSAGKQGGAWRRTERTIALEGLAVRVPREG